MELEADGQRATFGEFGVALVADVFTPRLLQRQLGAALEGLRRGDVLAEFGTDIGRVRVLDPVLISDDARERGFSVTVRLRLRRRARVRPAGRPGTGGRPGPGDRPAHRGHTPDVGLTPHAEMIRSMASRFIRSYSTSCLVSSMNAASSEPRRSVTGPAPPPPASGVGQRRAGSG